MRNILGIFLSVAVLNSALAAESAKDHSLHQGGGKSVAPVVKPGTSGELAAPKSAAPDSAAPWSYAGRVNPEVSSKRWEMVPVPGYGHMFISTQNVSPELVCAALNTPGVMLDRATQKRCDIARVPADAPASAGHGGH